MLEKTEAEDDCIWLPDIVFTAVLWVHVTGKHVVSGG